MIFKHANGELWNGDCLDLMRQIPDGSVDMVLCDLPYGTTACSWDSIIPFEALWREYKRVIKRNAAIVLTASQPFTTALIASNYEMFKYCWVWKKAKPTGFSHSKNMPLKDYEDVCVFSNGSIAHANLSENRMVYNPQGVFEVERKITRNKKGFDGTMERASQVNEYVGKLSGFPKMVQEFNNVLVGTIHPTQKPVALFEYLIKTYTNHGETVLDNCSGSGTTAVAAINTGRRFICIEKDLGYYLASCGRVHDHT